MTNSSDARCPQLTPCPDVSQAARKRAEQLEAARVKKAQEEDERQARYRSMLSFI